MKRVGEKKKNCMILSRIINYFYYHYPLSESVHKITNYYSKNEELHFSYIAVYFNLAIISLISYAPFIILQEIKNPNNESFSNILSLSMFHKYDKKYVQLSICSFLFNVIINTLVIYFKISYVKAKEVESEAQSIKDLTNFTLVFSSVNFRL